MTGPTNSSKTSTPPSPKAVGWKTVNVFVSSTFDDMHAERDYLVKEVFPRLREWCEQRRLRLVDVDLRWGVTEADATNNKRVVDVCLRRIDDCRPFFICLLGQRYGWIPRRQDVAAETSGAYPHVAGALGAASVTEMEIQHSTVAGKHVSDAFFYLRDPSYLADLPSDPAQLRQRIYTDEAEEDAADRKEKLRSLREQKIPAPGRPVRQYSARWEPGLRTPEIALPPQCPATLPENIETWRKNWQRWADVRVGGTRVDRPANWLRRLWQRGAGGHVVGTDVDEDAAEGAKAAAHNAKLTLGRLTDFAVGERPLGDVIFEDLREAIALRFPDHVEAGEQTDLQRELDLQEELIAAATEGFIGRAADLAVLDEYADSDDARLFAVAAAGGIGKTTLLAKWIANRREQDDVVFCRFIGVGDRSSSVDSLLALLVDELGEAGRIQGEIPTDPRKLREKLPELLAECGKHGRAIIVIDALNQLDSGLGDLDWLPKAMPAGLKIVVSFKTGTAVADELLAHWRAGEVRVHECRGFENIEDRKKLVTGYLERHLKELDQVPLESLVTVPGAENPLYLRVVLGELRVFGAFGQLREKLAHDFGTTPIEAFAGVLRRLETDPAHAAVPPATTVPLIFGMLAHAHGGLPEASIVDLVETEVKLGAGQRSEVAASVALVLRQLRPYLAHREGRVDFFFESFHLAAKQRYTRPDAELPVRSEIAWHDALANWCTKWDRLEGAGKRYALRWLPTHQMDAARAADAVEAMTNFGYHHARLVKLGAGDVIEVRKDLAALVRSGLPAERCERVGDWQQFHDENAHFLQRSAIRPEVELLQRATAHADTSAVTVSAEAWLDRKQSEHWWFRRLGRPGKIVRNAFLRVLEGHAGWVLSVATHPDGWRAVSGSRDNTLRVWNLETGECIRTLRGHTNWVSSVVIHPDGRRAVTGSHDRTLRFWDLETGECIRTLRGQAEVWSLAIHPDWRQAVTGSDCGAWVWDLEVDECARMYLSTTDMVHCVAIHANRRQALTGGEGPLRAWDLKTGERLKETWAFRTASLAIHQDGQRAVTGDTYNTVRVWDLDTGECLRTLEGHTNVVKSVALHSDGRRAVTGSWDKTVRVWDLDTGECLKTFQGHEDCVLSVALHPDGRRVVTGGEDKAVRVWDLNADTPACLIRAHANHVSSVALHANGRRAVTGGGDETARVWNPATGECLKTLQGHRGSVNSVALHPDGRRAVTGALHDKTVRVWDLETGECLHMIEGHSGAFNSIKLCADGRRAVSILWSNTVLVWDLETGESLTTLDNHSQSEIKLVAIHSDGRRVITEDWNTLRAWDMETGECLRTLQVPQNSYLIVRAALHIDGRRVVTGHEDGTVRVLDLETGECLNTLRGHAGRITSIVLHADGRRAVTGSQDKVARVWDLETGECLTTLAGHTESIELVELHWDGRRAVTGSCDNTLRIWNIESGECLGTWFGVSSFHSIASGKPLANGRVRIVAGCGDGSVHFFELMPPGPLARTTFATWSPTHVALATALETGNVTLYQWHASSARLEQLAHSPPFGTPISSLRFSLDGTRLQVLAADNTEHILDATTLQPAPLSTCAWADPLSTSPDGAWRVVILDGRIVVEAVKPRPDSPEDKTS